MALASPPPRWLTTELCDLPSTGPREWAAFLFLSACSQRVLLSAASAVFLIALLCQGAAKLISTRWRRRHGSVADDDEKRPLLDRGRAGAGFVVALATSGVLAAFYAVLLVLSLVARGGGGGEALVPEAVFLALQCAAHLGTMAVIAHEKRFRAAAHPLALRLYWLAAPVLTALLAGTSAARLRVPSAARLPDDALAIRTASRMRVRKKKM